MLYNYCSKKKMKRFVPKNGVPKNGFPIVFSKSDLGEGGHILWRHFFLKKPNTPEYAQVLVVTCPKLKSVAALLSPPIKLQVQVPNLQAVPSYSSPPVLSSFSFPSYSSLIFLSSLSLHNYFSLPIPCPSPLLSNLLPKAPSTSHSAFSHFFLDGENCHE